MSRKQKNDPPAGALPNPEVDNCEHIDDDNDGVCDLCGIEVEAETESETSTDSTPNLAPEPITIAPDPADPTVVLQSKQYYVKTGVGSPFYKGKSYREGEAMPLTAEDAPRWTKFVEYR